MNFFSLMQYILRQHIDLVAVSDPHKGLRYEIKRKTPIIDPLPLNAIPASGWPPLDLNTLSTFTSTLNTHYFRRLHIDHVNKHLAGSVTSYPALKESDVLAFLYSSDLYKWRIDETCKNFERVFSEDSTFSIDVILFNLSCYYTADELSAHILTFKEQLCRKIDTVYEAGLLLNVIQPQHLNTIFELFEKELLSSGMTHVTFFKLADDVSDETFAFLCMKIKLHYEQTPKENKKAAYLRLFQSAPHVAHGLSTATKGKIERFYAIFEDELYNTFGRKFYETFIHILWRLHFNNGNLNNIPLAIEALAPKISNSVDRIFYQKLPSQFYDHKIKENGQVDLKDEGIDLHFEVLFGSLRRWGDPGEKMHQIKVALAEFRMILFCPELCVYLLKDFESSLEAAWKKEFPNMPINELNGETMTKKLESVSWKIPVQKPTFKANSFLQRHCIQFMQERGYAKNGTKMLSFIADGRFEDAIRKGDFFTEPAFNPYFLLHGKITHNIGRIILILAYEKNLLSHSEEITLDELFASLVNPDLTNPVTGKGVWIEMFDLATPSKLTFCDPHLLHASLMSACDESLPCLSAAMRHSFGKKVYALTDYFNWATKLNWSAEQVWDRYIAPRVPFATQASQGPGDPIPNELSHYLRYAQEHKQHTTMPALLMHRHRLYEANAGKEECKPASELHLKN